jgi:hypothetical protein
MALYAYHPELKGDSSNHKMPQVRVPLKCVGFLMPIQNGDLHPLRKEPRFQAIERELKFPG